MARSHWIAVGACSSLLAALVTVACGSDSTDGGTPSLTSDGGGGDSSTPRDGGGPRDAAIDTGIDAAVEIIDGGTATVTPLTLDFGEVNCGETGPGQTFRIENPSSAPATWSGALGKAGDSPFTITPVNGTVPAGEFVLVTVSPKPAPSTASTATNGLADTVTLSLGDGFATVTLKQSAKGAVLSFLPSAIGFGNFPLAANASEQAFTILNTGNFDAPVTLTASGAGFAISEGASITAMPGQTSAKVTFDPSELRSYSGSVKLGINPNIPLCGELPPDIALTGRGTNGIISSSSNSILFNGTGLVDCGSTAAAQKVTITNTGNAIAAYTTSFGKSPSPFNTVTPLAGNIPANGSVELTITPRAIPATSLVVPDNFSDVLNVDFAALPAERQVIALKQTARGAIVTRSTPGPLNFGSIGFGNSSTQNFGFTNNGNVDITLNLLKNLPVYAVTTPVTLTQGGGTAQPNVTFTPSGVQSFPDTLTPQNAGTTPVCAAIPGAMNLTGAGITGGTSASPASPLNIGFVPCGSTGEAKKVIFTNNGGATTWSAILTRRAGSPFTISPQSGNIGAGGTVEVTITPNAIPGLPTVNSTSTNAINDTIEFTNGNNPVTPFFYGVNETAQGAVIRLSGTTSFGTTPFPFGVMPTPERSLTVQNAGNIQAAVNLAMSTGAGFTAVTGSTLVNGGQSDTGVVVAFSPPVLTPANTLYTGQWSATTNAVLCAPLPVPLSITARGQN